MKRTETLISRSYHDFTEKYTYPEFCSLLWTYVDKEEFAEHRHLEFAKCLLDDYEGHYANVFGYIPKDNVSARLVLELRKSFVINAEDYFFQYHPLDTIANIKAYRVKWFKEIFPWYQDTSEDYEWVKNFFVPKENRDYALNHYEHMLKDGNIMLDRFSDPIQRWINNFFNFSKK